MKLNKFQKDFLRFIGLRLANFVVNVLLKTVRINIRNNDVIESLNAKKQNFIVAFWHGTMLIGWYLHRRKNCAALVSKSKDGDVLAHVLTKWEYNVVRGSSHIGGKEALEMMIGLVNDKYSLVITPDGPTGPVHKMKAGAVVAAKKTNVPLLLVGIGFKNKITLKSWDGFEIPKPFSRVEVIYSDAIYIDKELSYEETSTKIEECEKMLVKLRKDAVELC